MKRSNPFMTVEQLNEVLQQYGCYVREKTTIDESTPYAKWVIITSHSTKIGCDSYIDLATKVRRIENENATFGNSETATGTPKELTSMTTTSANNVQAISLSAIDTSIKTYQIRDNGINEQNVEALVYSDASTWLPLILKQIGDNRYAVVSGFHRIEARKQQIVLEAHSRYETENERNNAIAHANEHETLNASIIPENLDENETRLLAYRFNSEHGLPLTMAEKKKYAVLLHLSNPNMPDYKIAMIAHISDKTVTQAIKDYEAEIARNNTDATTEDETPSDDDAVEDIDFDAKFKKLASTLRKFYTEVITEIDTDEKVTSYLVRHFNKQATTEGETQYDGDIELLKTLSSTMSKAVKRLSSPKAETVAKQPKEQVTKAPKAPKAPKTPKTKTTSLIDDMVNTVSTDEPLPA